MSVTERSEKNTHWEDARARFAADFRTLRTPGGAARWIGALILGLIVTAIVILYFLDWNQMRGPIGRYLSAKTGREVRLDGNLAVKLFTWQPSVDAHDIYVGNPKWVGSPQAAKVHEFQLE